MGSFAKSPPLIQFNGHLTRSDQARVDACDRLLTDPARLEALDKTGLMNSGREAAFDRLAYLAARLLKVPLTIISLVGEDKQFFKAAYGLPAPFDTTREVPIGSSICRYTLHSEPIIVNDASTHSFLSLHPTTSNWGIAAFIALPVSTEDGQVLGAFCAVDSKKRVWSDDDIHVMRELTTSAMSEIKLRTQVAELELERSLRERFVTTLTHDLRTPLTSAKMGAEYLSLNAGDKAAVRQIAGRIATNMNRADRMIQDLLDGAAIGAGKLLPLQKQQGNLQPVLIETLTDLRTMYGDRFIFECDDTAAGNFNAGGLRRIVENLCANAVKYGAVDQPIAVSLKSDPSRIVLSVKNFGNPISATDQVSLFEAFTRSRTAILGSEVGWGLGLTLVKGLAEAHGGTVAVTSSAVAGTEFTVSFPRL